MYKGYYKKQKNEEKEELIDIDKWFGYPQLRC